MDTSVWNSPFNQTQCKWPTCTKKPTSNGFCKGHTRTIQNQTSDGVITGGQKCKLTESDVKEAKKMRSKFKTQVEIAKHFGVTPEVIRKALSGNYKPRPDGEI